MAGIPCSNVINFCSHIFYLESKSALVVYLYVNNVYTVVISIYVHPEIQICQILDSGVHLMNASVHPE